MLLPAWVNTPIKKIALIGLGKADKLKLDSLRKAAAAIARTAKKEKAKTLGISLPVWNNDGAATTGAIAEGVILALHEDRRFKSATEEKDKNGKVEAVHLLGLGEMRRQLLRQQRLPLG